MSISRGSRREKHHRGKRTEPWRSTPDTAFIINFHHMNHTSEQIHLMLKAYFTTVANLDPWAELEPGEVEGMVKDCRFAEVDNVLFLLTPAPENYQAFTIENGALVPLHQEHRAEFCSTCREQEESAASQEAF
ncbi:MAG: hypothetical protein JNJ46_27475 [Myxococcales bacterium]|nr:hypothetical protein [Myxococcales bacterium]